jgi:hypothetical protein
VPIPVKCSSCSKTYRVKDELAGKTFRCRDCGETVRVGNGQAPTKTAPRRRPEPKPEARLPARKSTRASGNASSRGGKRKSKKAASGSKTPLLIAGIAGLVLVVGGAAFFMRSNDPVTEQEQTADTTPGEDLPPQESVVATTTPDVSAQGPAQVSTTPNPAPQSSLAPTVAAAPQPAPIAAVQSFPIQPDAVAWEWGKAPRIKLDPQGADIEYPASRTPVLATGFSGGKYAQTESWNFATGKKIGQLKGDAPTSGARSLSPDGTMLAALDGKRVTVDFWSYLSGTKTGTVSDLDGGGIGEVLLVSSTRLLTYKTARNGSDLTPTVRLYSVPDGQQLKSITVKNPWRLKQLCVSATGRYLVDLDTTKGLLIYETESLELLASIPLRKGSVTTGGTAFSPDGTQLAAVYTTLKETTVAVVNLADGSLTDTSLPGRLNMSPITGQSYLGPGIEWFPDGSGWCLYGRTFVDAATGLRLWTVDALGINGVRPRHLLPGAMLARKGGYDLETRKSKPQELILVKWPQADIQQSLAALASGSGILRPGSMIDVMVETGELKHGQPAETQTELAAALKERLEGDSMVIGKESGIVLYAHYSEMDGRTLQQRNMNRGTASSAPPAPAGPGIQSTVAIIKLELRLPDKTKPVWSTEIEVDPRVLIIRGTATAESAREAMFSAAQTQITSAAIPYFIPENSKLPALPGLTMYDSM